MEQKKDFEDLMFLNSIINFGLPIDENKENNIKKVKGFNYSKVTPTKLKNVSLSCLSSSCMKWIGLHKENYSKEDKKLLAELLCGNKIFNQSIPISHCYCGHQFGYFAG